jgi:hypothetical protein
VAYANPDDLASFMQQTLDAGTATLILQMVADEMDVKMGAEPEDPVGSVTVDGVTYTGAALTQSFTDMLLDGPAQGSSILLLPRFPVSALAEVQVQDTIGTWTTLTYQLDYLWSARSGILTRIRAGIPSALGPAQFPGPPLSTIEYMRMEPIWPSIPQGIMASFTAGHTAVPGSLKDVNLGAAARTYANPTGVVGETVGGYSVRYSPRADGGIGGISFNTLELDVLGKFKTVRTS